MTINIFGQSTEDKTLKPVNERLNKNTSAISNNDSRITTNESDISTAQNDIAYNAFNISTNNSGISNNSSRITSNDNELQDHETRITTAESDISANASTISFNTLDIGTNISNITTNTNRINTAETNINRLSIGGIRTLYHTDTFLSTSNRFTKQIWDNLSAGESVNLRGFISGVATDETTSYYYLFGGTVKRLNDGTDSNNTLWYDQKLGPNDFQLQLLRGGNGAAAFLRFVRFDTNNTTQVKFYYHIDLTGNVQNLNYLIQDKL